MVQVIVYAGAVMTLFLFVIMFIGVDRAEDTEERIPRQRALVAALALIVVVGAGVLVPSPGPVDLGAGGPGRGRGAQRDGPSGATMLFEEWVLAFEVTSLLLVVAAAGAIALAYFRPSPQDARSAESA